MSSLSTAGVSLDAYISHSTYTFTLEDQEEELEQLLCAVAAFSADQAAFSKMQAKGKVSKKGLKGDLSILRSVRDVLSRRLSQYPHTYEVSLSSRRIGLLAANN